MLHDLSFDLYKFLNNSLGIDDRLFVKSGLISDLLKKIHCLEKRICENSKIN